MLDGVPSLVASAAFVPASGMAGEDSRNAQAGMLDGDAMMSQLVARSIAVTH